MMPGSFSERQKVLAFNLDWLVAAGAVAAGALTYWCAASPRGALVARASNIALSQVLF